MKVCQYPYLLSTVADLRKYESDIKAVVPGCWRKNLTAVAVSINLLFVVVSRKPRDLGGGVVKDV